MILDGGMNTLTALSFRPLPKQIGIYTRSPLYNNCDGTRVSGPSRGRQGALPLARAQANFGQVKKFPAPPEVYWELYPMLIKSSLNRYSGFRPLARQIGSFTNYHIPCNILNLVSGPSRGRQVSIRGFGMIPKFRAWFPATREVDRELYLLTSAMKNYRSSFQPLTRLLILL